MAEEEKGFKVKDHRHFDESGQLREEDANQQDQTPDPAPEEPAAQAEAASAQESAQAEEPQEEPKAQSRVLPPVDFSSFIFSMSHAALMHMGQIPDPGTGQTHNDPDLARHTIDTIAMFQEKTEGNLTPEEKSLIDNVLTELRLAFVKLNG